ncbi:MAG: prolipoprotein diacylglyceryl transferase [Patescibacteria group bacterium]|nr:prolipoprotein diacylglyceryl transferase [Patescibacteria group bacterium]
MPRAAKKNIIIGLIIIAACLVLWFFAQVFSGRVVLPQTFRFGPLTIHYYGLTMAAAVAAGFWLAVKRAPKFGVEPKLAEDLLFWIAVGGFVGARLYHVLSSIGYYYRHPIDIFKVYNGGLSIYGAVLAGIFALWLMVKIRRLSTPLLNLLDWLAPSVVLGQIIGRLGNFFNYEAFGYPTNLPWKMFVPTGFRPENFVAWRFFHPWFLYEILGNLLILAWLLRRGKPIRSGTVVFSYLLLYNLLRFGLEFLRIDSTFLGAVRLNAAASFILVLASAVALKLIRRHDHNDKTA